MKTWVAEIASTTRGACRFLLVWFLVPHHMYESVYLALNWLPTLTPLLPGNLFDVWCLGSKGY